MTFAELLSRIALSFGIGLLIGLERGWHTRRARPGSRTAGVRTFTISGLVGGIVGALAQTSDGELSTASSILIGCALLAYAAVITVFTRDENRATGTFSATTTIAALLTFVLGAYALLGDVRVAAAAAVATTGILIIREALHDWVARITLREFESGLILLAMTFIALPMLPNREVGPLGGVNIRVVWIIAIVLALVSFAGYVFVKLLGERKGSLVAAAAGGLISSTAVTMANARRVAAGEGSAQLLAAGAVLATAVSYVRVAVLVAALAPTLNLLVGAATLSAAAVAAAFAFVAVRVNAPQQTSEPEFRFRNPFGFWYVLGLALSMAVLILAGRLIYQRFGSGGVVAGAAAMGLFDVDAMTVSIARLALQPIENRLAACAILAGVACNTLSKVVIAAVIAPRAFATRVAIGSLVPLVVGGAALLAALGAFHAHG
jgi:uncharacterized membrane protein (DUF4010 family)